MFLRFVEYLYAYYVVDIAQLLSYILQDLDGLLPIVRVEQLGFVIRDARVGFSVLTARCAMEINQYTDAGL